MIVNPTLHRNHMTILCGDQCDRIIVIMKKKKKKDKARVLRVFA